MSIAAHRAAVTALCLSVVAATPALAGGEPGLQDYPEGAKIGRALTPLERLHVKDHPILAGSGTETPTGPVHCVAEYEPMQGLLIAWEGSSSWTAILAQMAAHVTTTGDADIYCVVDSASERTTATAQISAAGADMLRVEFIIRTTDTIWIRDYGPRYIYEGLCRAVVDHTYNRPRPWDNAFPDHFSQIRNHAHYDIPLVHGGGNYHLNALDLGNASELIVNENPGLTEAQIVQHWMDYQNVDTTIWTPLPTSVDATQHIDMWMQIVADDVIIISDWPAEPGSYHDQLCDSAAADFASWGWSVHRVPARRSGGTHYTYTNMVMCNDLVLLPSYTNSLISPYNSQALAAVQAACPDHVVVPINCQAIVSAAGVMHCIVMHVPEPLGGESPTAYLKNLRGGETLTAGEIVEISWISDDDVGVLDADLLLSTNGGASFDTTIATGTADDGAYTWEVPDVTTSQSRLRVVVRDADSNSGADESDADFTIEGTAVPGDVDGDGDVDFQDLLAMLAAWGDCPDPPAECPADFDGNGTVDFNDLLTLLAGWSAP